MPETITRRYHRRPLRVEFRVRDANDTIGGELLFESLDVSEGGAFLRSDYLLEPDERLIVSFCLPDQPQPIETHAKVVWVTKKSDIKGNAGMALQFLELREEARATVAEFVQAQRVSQFVEQTP